MDWQNKNVLLITFPESVTRAVVGLKEVKLMVVSPTVSFQATTEACRLILDSLEH